MFSLDFINRGPRYGDTLVLLFASFLNLFSLCFALVWSAPEFKSTSPNKHSSLCHTLTFTQCYRNDWSLPVWSSPAGWGNACWLIYFPGSRPGSAGCRWLGWPGWSRCSARGRTGTTRRRRRRPPPARALGARGAPKTAGPVERAGGRGRAGRSACWCAWQLEHDPTL